MIDENTTLEELAVLVSMALEDAGIMATLSGGAAVSVYSYNAYQSADLDFVTSEGTKVLREIIAKLKFKQSASSRLFEHPDTAWYVEFPPGPLRIITSTLSILDRLAAFWCHGDRQTWDQTPKVAGRQQIDWTYVHARARAKRRGDSDIDRLRKLAEAR